MSENIPDTLYAKIRVKRSITPSEVPSGLELGEIAINIPDQKIYVGDENNNAVQISSGNGSQDYTGQNGITISPSNVISFNGSNVSDNNIPLTKLIRPNNLSTGYLKYNGTNWVFASPVESISEGTGINITGTTISFDPTDNFTINLDKISGSGVSGGMGYLYWNGSEWSFDTPSGGENGGSDFIEYFAGSGLNLSSENVFSVNLSTINTGVLPLNFVDGGSSNTGFLSWNGSTWSFSAGGGSGISSAIVNTEGDLIITLSDESTINAGNVIGPEGPQGIQGLQGVQGPQGETGIGITNAIVNTNGELVLFLTEGDPINVGSVIGPEGPPGSGSGSGEEYFAGTGLDLSTNNQFSVNLSTVDTGSLPLTFVNGGNENSGFLYWDGNEWAFSCGGASAFINTDGDLILTLAEGNSLNLGNVIGPQGPQGEIGPEGPPGSGEEYFAGTGLDLSTNNEFSINLDTIDTGKLSLNLLAQNGATTGQVLKWNGTAWAPSIDFTGDGGGGNSYFDFCTYVNEDNKIAITGGSSSDSTICDYIETEIGSGGSGNIFLTAGSGIDIVGSVISVNPNTIEQETLSLTKLNISEISAKGNPDGFLKWTNAEGWIFESGTGGGDGDFYFAGTGLRLDTENTFHFDPESLLNYSISINKISANTSSSGFLYWNGSAWIVQSSEETDGTYQAGNGIEIIESNSAIENIWTFSVLAGNGLTFSGNNLVVDTSLVPVINNINEIGFLYWSGTQWSFEDFLSSDYIGSIVEIENLLDVNVTNRQNGDMLIYSDSDNAWVNIQMGTYQNGILSISGGNASLY